VVTVIKFSRIIVLFVFLLGGQSAFCSLIISEKDSTLIHNCNVNLPSWWNNVNISLPDSINSVDDLRVYCFTIKDTSSKVKLWYLGIKKMDLFPSYIGDAWFDIGRYNDALNLYQKILPCVVNEKGRSNEWECYLYYKIGKCYEGRKENNVAIEWYRKAIDQKFSVESGKTKINFELALCAYRCLMNIRCDK
jgi:tetratricopeptide (TPR) repeat protein